MAVHKHPTRSQMNQAIHRGDESFAASVAGCASCALVYSYLKNTLSYGNHTIVQPPNDALMRQQGIARLVNARCSSPTVTGEIFYDSWSTRPPVAVRSTSVGLERRIRLRSGEYTLELVAERCIDQWEFVGRVYRNDKVCSEFSLKAGRQSLYPKQQKCYFWSSKHPTRRIKLQSAEIDIDFGELSW